ncbi:hypothetical protein BGW80DRAFT_1566331 [Lactifluus volemus]|nr:hypothetical protein BGW80DRAFT_1566331 [Lactifluus volemus]
MWQRHSIFFFLPSLLHLWPGCHQSQKAPPGPTTDLVSTEKSACSSDAPYRKYTQAQHQRPRRRCQRQQQRQHQSACNAASSPSCARCDTATDAIHRQTRGDHWQPHHGTTLPSSEGSTLMTATSGRRPFHRPTIPMSFESSIMPIAVHGAGISLSDNHHQTLPVMLVQRSLYKVQASQRLLMELEPHRARFQSLSLTLLAPQELKPCATHSNESNPATLAQLELDAARSRQLEPAQTTPTTASKSTGSEPPTTSAQMANADVEPLTQHSSSPQLLANTNQPSKPLTTPMFALTHHGMPSSSQHAILASNCIKRGPGGTHTIMKLFFPMLAYRARVSLLAPHKLEPCATRSDPAMLAYRA